MSVPIFERLGALSSFYWSPDKFPKIATFMKTNLICRQKYQTKATWQKKIHK